MGKRKSSRKITGSTPCGFLDPQRPKIGKSARTAVLCVRAGGTHAAASGITLACLRPAGPIRINRAAFGFVGLLRPICAALSPAYPADVRSHAAWNVGDHTSFGSTAAAIWFVYTSRASRRFPRLFEVCGGSNHRGSIMTTRPDQFGKRRHESLLNRYRSAQRQPSAVEHRRLQHMANNGFSDVVAGQSSHVPVLIA